MTIEASIVFSESDGCHLIVVPLVPTQARLAVGGGRGQGVKQSAAALLQNNATHAWLTLRALQVLQVKITKEGGQTWQWAKRTKPTACRPDRNTRPPQPRPGILRQLAMYAEVVATLKLLQRAETTLLWAGAGGFDVKEEKK